MKVLPRLLRYRDAPAYPGMDRNRFDAEVRPTLTEIPIGVLYEKKASKDHRAGFEPRTPWFVGG